MDEEIISLIKLNLQLPSWVNTAREDNIKLDALITGKNFKTLIKKIEGVENSVKSIARENYSKDIRDLSERILQPRQNVFTASGGSFYNNIKGDKNLKTFEEKQKNFKGQKSITKYLSENLFRLSDIDPNGIVFVEYKGKEEIYPTFKSIKDIRNYKSNGQLLEWVLFEPVNIKLNGGNSIVKRWRYVDANMDISVLQIGENFTIEKEKSFTHPFGIVPAFIVSAKQEMGSELRISTINSIVPLMEDYAAFKSVSTILRYTNGFPLFWAYEALCRACRGGGSADGKVCKECSGTGQLIKRDVTDVRIIDMPRDKESAIVTPHLMGWVSPDLDTLKYFDEKAIDDEQRMESTYFGTKRINSKNQRNETATGRFIDTQPIITKLSELKSVAEWADNFLMDMLVNWIFGKKQDENFVTKLYGDRFIIESQDVLIDKYATAREKGLPITILDKMLEEFIYAKFGTNEQLLNEQLKKKDIEPYVHYTVEQVKEILGDEEAKQKIIFADFWEIADKRKTKEQLEKDFLTFKNK